MFASIATLSYFQILSLLVKMVAHQTINVHDVKEVALLTQIVLMGYFASIDLA